DSSADLASHSVVSPILSRWSYQLRPGVSLAVASNLRSHFSGTVAVWLRRRHVAHHEGAELPQGAGQFPHRRGRTDGHEVVLVAHGERDSSHHGVSHHVRRHHATMTEDSAPEPLVGDHLHPIASELPDGKVRTDGFAAAQNIDPDAGAFELESQAPG